MSDLDRLSECDSLISTILLDIVWNFNVVKSSNCDLNTNNIKDLVIDSLSKYNYNSNKLVDALLSLEFIKKHLRRKQLSYKSLFRDHLHVYSLLFHPSTPFEIRYNSRLSEFTKKSEYSLVATRNIPKDTLISNCLATLIKISHDQDKVLRDSNNDWSILTSLTTGTRIFLGPARFANHDCDNNVQLERTQNHVYFRTKQWITPGQEVLLNYGNHYFSENNENCFCLTCETNNNGAFKHLNYNTQDNQLRTRFNSYIRSNTTSSTNYSSASSSLTPLSSLSDLNEILCSNDKCKNEKLENNDECHTCLTHRRIYQNSWPSRNRLKNSSYQHEYMSEDSTSESSSAPSSPSSSIYSDTNE